MKRIKTYHRFLNEEKEIKGLLFRSTSIQWLMDFLNKGEAVPLRSKKRYISFSKESDSGGMDYYGPVRIDFDANELYKQGAIEIEYSQEFFEENPEICMYVTGYKGEEDYYKQSGYKGKEDFEETGQDDANTIMWLTLLEDYEGEAEVVLKKLKFKKGLIKQIVVNEELKNRDFIKDVKEKGIKIKFE